MKREGYQHGMVRCHLILPGPLNPRPETRYLNRFDSPPTSGLFTRVLKKPTNHSKFTGKCGRPKCRACHEAPAYKSKDKTKGTQKLRFLPGLNQVGFSRTGFLAEMDGEEEYYVDEMYEESCEVACLANDIKNGDEVHHCVDEVHDIKNIDEVHDCEVESLEVDIKSGDENENDEICELAFDDEYYEGWCIVEETLYEFSYLGN